MTKNNKRKKHGISKRWYIRAVLLITMLLTVTAAGCFGKPSKPADNPTTTTPELTEAVTPELTEAATPEPTEAATPKPTEAATPKPTEAVTPEPTEEEEATAKSIEVSVAEAVAGLQLDGWSVPSGGLSFTLDESGLAELKKSQRELYDAILVILKITGDGGTAGWEGIPRTKDGKSFTVTISETYVVIVIYDGRKAPSPSPTPSLTPTPTPKPTATPVPAGEEEAAAKSIETSVAEAVAGLQVDGWSVPSGGLSFTLDESGLAELKKSQRELYDAILVILKITGDGGTAGWEGIPKTKDGQVFAVTISETYVVIVVIYDGRKEPSPTPTPALTPTPKPSPTPKPTPTPKPSPTPTSKPSPTPKPTATPIPAAEVEAAAKSIETSVAEAVTESREDGWSVPSGGLSFTLDEAGLTELKVNHRRLYNVILIILRITDDGGTVVWDTLPRTEDGTAFTVTISGTYEINVIYNGRKEPSPTPKPSPTPTPKPTPTPTPTPKPTATPKPSSGTAFTPSGTGGRVTFSGNTVEVSKAKIGDTVLFGSYEQDNNTGNGAEAIEWLVLDKQDGKLLLLSKDVLDKKPYNEKYISVTWETCTLRSWLNGEFYNTAFSPAEQGRIATTKVKNEDNPEYGTKGGNDTEDKVFLLSIGEALNYFDPDPGAYDTARKAKFRGSLAWWWLRSPGYIGHNAAGVSSFGGLSMDGRDVNNGGGGVRPAFWLNLES